MVLDTSASGAQILSTDYRAVETARWSGGYFVALPGNAVVRCNPIDAPITCLANHTTSQRGHKTHY
jgi:hypothetical protein